MKNDQGKVIFSLLAGATAGIVAGLLLAPETGEQARAGLRQSAGKWGAGLRGLLGGAAAGQAPGHTNHAASVSEHRASADRLLAGLGTDDRDDNDLDYGGDGRHYAG